MSQTYPAAEQALLGRIVDQPAFRRLLELPLIAWQPIAVLILCYGVILGGAALYLQGSVPYLPVLLLSAIAIYAIFTPLHDATHLAVSRNRSFNDLIGTLAAQPMVPGTSTSLYRYLHLEHHRHTGDPDKDPDECVVSAGPVGRVIYAMFIELKWLQWYLRHLDQRSMSQRLQDLFALMVYIAWHVVWLASPYALEFVMLWVLPQRLGLGIVATLFATIQHPEGVRQSEQPLQASRMFRDGPLLRLAMLSQSQHLMHHMFPMVPFYRYNQAWKLSEPQMREQALVWANITRPLVQPAATATKDSGLLEVRIESITDITDEIRAYSFAASDGSALPAFTPGAHIDVHIAPGLVRQYSLTGLAQPGCYSIAVKREDAGRGGSRTLHQQFTTGQQIRISKPRNLFSLQSADQHAVLISGGIGITPLLSMARDLASRDASFEMHVCARDTNALPFGELLRQMPAGDKVSTWLDTDGGFTAMPAYAAGHSLYLCGPQGFMDYVRGLARDQGWPDEAIHSEAFVADLDTANNRPFRVELARSGKSIELAAEQSLLDALQAHHVPIAASCEQGICGTCQCKVLKGEVEHRDKVFNAEQRAQGLMTSCVSRAQGEEPLVLDL